MPEIVPTFTAHGWIAVPERGWEVVVALDQETSDFAHLLQQTVRIDGTCYRCASVHAKMHSPPWRVGEWISLLVRDGDATTSGDEHG